MSHVAIALSIARLNLYERLDAPQAAVRAYANATDAELLHRIINIVDERPTYGCRRVWAVLRRQLQEAALSAVNDKRVYRLMKQHGLLLAGSPMRHEKRAHTGKL